MTFSEDLNFQFSEKINKLDKNSEYVTRAEVEAIVQQALKDAGVI